MIETCLALEKSAVLHFLRILILSEDSGIISYIKKKQECSRMDKLKFKKLEVII